MPRHPGFALADRKPNNRFKTHHRSRPAFVSWPFGGLPRNESQLYYLTLNIDFGLKSILVLRVLLSFQLLAVQKGGES